MCRTSGLVEAMKVVGSIEGISFIHFDERDVVRHKLVQQIVKAYEKFSNGAGGIAARPSTGSGRADTLAASPSDARAVSPSDTRAVSPSDTLAVSPSNHERSDG